MVTASCKTLSWQPGIQLFFEFFPEDFQSRFALFEQEHFDFIDEFGGSWEGNCSTPAAVSNSRRSRRQQDSPDCCRAGIMPVAATGGHYPA